MAKRWIPALACSIAFTAAPALAGDNPGQQKAALDSKLAAVQAKIARTRAQESRLNNQIGTLDTQIHRLEARAGDMASRISSLQTDLALRHRRLDVLNALYRVQTTRVRDLRHAYTITLSRLDNTLVTIYKSPQPGTLDLVLQAKSIQDIIDEFTYLGLVTKQQEAIVHQVAAAKQRVALAREKTLSVRRRVADQTNLIRARLEQVAVIHNELLTNTHNLSNDRAHQSLALLLARAQEQAAVKESDAIQAASAAIEAKIQAAQRTDNTAPATSTEPSSPAATPSAAGLIWPVNGPITSPFGPRWGGFHPGIDIGVPMGTPIHAAAAGTVIWCGWETGYGNLVVIDHHNGLATAYAHQSRIAVSCNQDVGQGQVIGYVGCTGFCTGPHLHFEVRVNGTPVDPLGYLP
jgi:murein DD-endopeptidase MepM/ murein hydrolase activator NlpD